MPFDTALSGIRAASNDLSITGNNIANASTTGFKSSRAEFGDVYATSVLGAGSNPIGSGLRLQDVSQSFTQGSISFTENELDLAINGNGFFVVQNDGEQFYTRSGAFGIDQNGYVTSNTGGRLQGFPADAQGNISGLQDDIQIETSNLAPQPTTRVESLLNLDATEQVLQSNGRSFSTEGNAIGAPQVGLQTATTTTLTSAAVAFPPILNPGDPGYPSTPIPVTFTVDFANGSGNNGQVTVNLDLEDYRVDPANPDEEVYALRRLIGDINTQLSDPQATTESPIDLIASAETDATTGDQVIQFSALQEGEPSTITINHGGDANIVNFMGLNATENNDTPPGTPAADNGYPQQSIEITNPNGNIVTYTADAGQSAASTASELNALAGVSATARTTATLLASGFSGGGNMTININGVNIQTNNLETLGDEINALTSSTLPGISAEVDTVTGDLIINSAVGDDLSFTVTGDPGDTIAVLGDLSAPTESLEVGVNDAETLVVGGAIDIVLDEGYSVDNPTPPSIGLFGPLIDSTFTDVTLNAFDPTDQATYNAATSMNIYDSLGNSHVLTQYFVRQEYDPNDSTTSPNHWVMYVQIDGEDVGDPDTTLPPPQNTLATQAGFNVYFNEDGSLNDVISDEILISNWTPLDEEGNPNGALGPQNVLAGGTTNIPDPPTSSNFVVDLEGTTQFGSVFSVNDVDQNGFTTGRLSGLNIDDSGIIFARFTNGESQVLGQIVLADFANNQGLQPVGETMWAENFESGPPNIGTPGSAALGAIQAGGLEGSNVDLSEELVALIIAQRNFQASAKTIETADQVTQTVINIR